MRRPRPGCCGTRGGEDFLPLYRSRRRWSDRLKEIELPLFAGYVFCRFAPEERVPVLRTPGVRSIVTFDGRPAPVSEEEVAAMRQAVGSGLPVQPWPFLRAGQPVRIERGPLSGLCGVLVRAKDSWRVVVSVELLQRSVAIEVDRDTLAFDAPPMLGFAELPGMVLNEMTSPISDSYHRYHEQGRAKE